jgi:hypothetical protein
MMRMQHGMDRWLAGLRRMFCWKRREACQPATPEPAHGEPRSEAEKALWQAMGWSEDAWGE